MIKNKRIIVFGAAGSIGSEIVRVLAERNKVYCVDMNESGLFDVINPLKDKKVWGRVGDIRDLDTIKDIFQDFKPQIVFNAAAYKHVPLMQYTPLEAIKTNVLGHYNIVHTAKTWECIEKLIFISTDKVVSSNSIMGATKRLSEIITINSGYSVVRLGNILNSRGSLLTIWEKQMQEGKPLTVTHPEMNRYMMKIEDAVRFILDVAEKEGKCIYVPKLKKKINVKDLAIEIIGMRDGETLTEELMFEEEKRRVKEEDNIYVIS